MIEIGRERIETQYGCIYIFNKERMLIELFRLKVKLPKEYFLEVISSYRMLKAKESISLSKVSNYCMKMTNGHKLLKKYRR